MVSLAERRVGFSVVLGVEVSKDRISPCEQIDRRIKPSHATLCFYIEQSVHIFMGFVGNYAIGQHPSTAHSV